MLGEGCGPWNAIGSNNDHLIGSGWSNTRHTRPEFNNLLVLEYSFNLKLSLSLHFQASLIILYWTEAALLMTVDLTQYYKILSIETHYTSTRGQAHTQTHTHSLPLQSRLNTAVAAASGVESGEHVSQTGLCSAEHLGVLERAGASRGELPPPESVLPGLDELSGWP